MEEVRKLLSQQFIMINIILWRWCTNIYVFDVVCLLTWCSRWSCMKVVQRWKFLPTEILKTNINQHFASFASLNTTFVVCGHIFTHLTMYRRHESGQYLASFYTFTTETKVKICCLSSFHLLENSEEEKDGGEKLAGKPFTERKMGRGNVRRPLWCGRRAICGPGTTCWTDNNPNPE